MFRIRKRHPVRASSKGLADFGSLAAQSFAVIAALTPISSTLGRRSRGFF